MSSPSVRRAEVRDVPGMARVMESNGLSRRELGDVGDHFVAERGGEIVGIVSFGVGESGDVVFGSPVVEPWAGEREVSDALFAGAGRARRPERIGFVGRIREVFRRVSVPGV